jgi:hypothetical protein
VVVGWGWGWGRTKEPPHDVYEQLEEPDLLEKPACGAFHGVAPGELGRDAGAEHEERHGPRKNVDLADQGRAPGARAVSREGAHEQVPDRDAAEHDRGPGRGPAEPGVELGPGGGVEEQRGGKEPRDELAVPAGAPRQPLDVAAVAEDRALGAVVPGNHRQAVNDNQHEEWNPAGEAEPPGGVGKLEQ